MKASDIPDIVMLKAVKSVALRKLKEGEQFAYSDGSYNGNPWVMVWDAHPEVNRLMGEVPFKVFMAKFKALYKRKLLDGCDCGCRGDMQITLKGKALMEASSED